ncbi:hypothetical protein Nhal_2160 [Nitrosococcus halophilus Nc 4]|uniref:Uncharacterized protein n=1 Tax=Nitrosococcus halophilus (strain Nc4) TaxID=472759 RepID=D5C536_NITHN|nr:hypothetical protein [Nitrosococcus halophilus]ADE15259.1 hypothetical protein Nhal_2160 [Nitrosococcus halophilus Nc 4]
MITINERSFELVREAREEAFKRSIPEQAMNVFFTFYLANYAAKLERALANSIEERTNEMIERCRGL